MAHLVEVVAAGGAFFQVTLQFPLFRVGQLAEDVWTEEMFEAILTHRGPPSARGLRWPV